MKTKRTRTLARTEMKATKSKKTISHSGKLGKRIVVEMVDKTQTEQSRRIKVFWSVIKMMCKNKEKLEEDKKKHSTRKRASKVYSSEVFRCDFGCGFSSKSLATMTNHMKRAHWDNTKKAYPCDECDLVLLSSKKLKKHQQEKHESQINMNCYKCDYVTNTKQDLSNHIRKHK